MIENAFSGTTANAGKRVNRRRSGRAVCVAALIALVGSTLSFTGSTANADAGDPAITGVLFVDTDRDGDLDAGESLDDSDPLFPPSGIVVTAYDSSGNSVAGTVTPGAPPTFSIDPGTLIGPNYRIEFEIDAADQANGWTPTVRGANSRSAVQFAQAGDAIAFGVIPPSSCRDGDGAVFLSCFALAGLTDTLVTINYDTSNKVANSIESDTGAVWGVAYDEWEDRVWTSAVLRRQFGLGPAGAAGLYMQTAGGAWSSFDLGASFLGGFNPATANEEQFAAAAGRIGIGDIDLSPDGRTLFVSNLADNAVHVYDVTAGTPTLTTIIPIGDPGCAVGDSHQIWALKSVSNDTALVGATCTAEGTNDADNLSASIVEVSTTGTVTPVPGLTGFPLNYERGCSTNVPGCTNFSHPWTDSSAVLWANSIVPSWGGDWNDYRQPLLSDIEIGTNGDLILGIIDRSAMQHTDTTTWDDSSTPDNEAANGWLNMASGGDVLHVDNVGSISAPSYVLDPAITVGGGAEFFAVDNAIWNTHMEISSGSAWVHPGKNELLLTVMDPLVVNSLGLEVADVETGSSIAGYELAGGARQFKAGGLGDVEGCFKPIEIGDRIWLDLDQDGIQDPDEVPLAGVTVTITGPGLPAGGLTVTTDANGNWTFDSLDGLLPDEDYVVTIDPSTNTTPLPGNLTNSDLFETTNDAGSNDESDSDVSGGTINVTTPSSGSNDHSFDAGYALPYDLALAKTLATFDIETRTATFEIEVINQGSPVQDFTVVDYLGAPIAGVWDDMQLGLVNPDGVTTGDHALDYTWDATDPQAPVLSVTGVLPAGDSVIVPITLNWADPLPAGASIDNWAEISSFDDDGDPTTPAPDDVDSTPDDVQTNDNQPANAGAATDDEVDQDATAGGDEDDHDIAGVQWWDLSLIKERSASQPYVVDYATSPPTISFDISVGNQGSEPAYQIGITDYIPAGTVYTTGAAPAMPSTTTGGAAVLVTDAGDGTYSIDSLVPGDSVTFTIVLDVVDLAVGSFENGAEISSFLDAGGNTQPDIDSTPDATDDDDVIDDATNSDDPANSHNDLGYDPDGDGNLNEPTPGDEDDHDVEVVVAPFDQALQKTVNSVSTPLFPAGTVTFDLTITNQGAPVERLEITDYIDPAMFEAMVIDATTNAPGTAAGAAASAFDYNWAGDATLTPTVLITPTTPGDKVAFGETIVVPITLTVAAGWDGSDLENWAEISMFDDDGDSANGDSAQAGTGEQLVDIDSTPDATDGNETAPAGYGQPGDDVITGDGDGTDPVLDDEDDHDVAGVPIYDVALIKDLAATQPYVVDLSTSPPQATFTITVKNQGNHPVTNVGVAEHRPTGTALNDAATDAANAAVAGLTRSGSAFTFAGPLAPGEVITFEVVLDITDPNAGPFLNEAEISALADAGGDPVNDIDSTVDAAPGNDVVESTTSAGDDVSDNSHDDVDNDRDADGAPVATPLDDDDHGQEQVVIGFDQALTKTVDLGQPSLADGVQVGDLITFDLVVTNQGAPVQTIEITDYPPVGMSYGSANNPDGTTSDSGDGDTFGFSWDAADPVVTLTGDSFDFGESITVPITLEVDATWPSGSLDNWAEVSRFDDDTDPANGDSAQAGTGEQLVDIDSTPDATDGNGPGEDPAADHVDDETGEDATTSGDEDDHDVAQIPVWDLHLIKTPATNQGPMVDLTATPPTISFDITVTNQGSQDAYNIAITDHLPVGTSYSSATIPDGVTDNADGTFVIDSLLVGASTTITITLELDMANAQDSYLNAAEISAFDNDADETNAIPAYVVDTDSTPSDSNTDAVIDHDDPAYDPNADGNLNEPTPGDEDDHDIEVVLLPFDQALRKTLAAAPAPPETLIPGGLVSFDIELFNQGRSIETLDVTDYIDPALWEAFDPSINVTTFAPVTNNANAVAPFRYQWTGSGTAPVVEIRPVTPGDQLNFGESVTVTITLQVAAGWNGSDSLQNLAEISNFDDSAATPGDAASGDLVDVDSTPDATNDEYDPAAPDTDSLIDDEIALTPATGDEDDHDIASLPGYWDLALIKTLNPTQSFVVDASDSLIVLFDITVKNQGALDAYDIAVTDHLPTGMAYSLANAPTMPTETDAMTPVTVVDNADGTYSIDQLAPGESVLIPLAVEITDPTVGTFVNLAEISEFDDGDPTTGTSADPDGPNDIDSVPNADPADDAIDESTDVDPANNNDQNSHNNIDNDRDGDGNALATPDDEDDHDAEVVTIGFDLAIRKTVDTAATTFPLAPGASVTFLIEVVNQGHNVAQVDVVDYIDPTLWETFDPAVNPDGVTGGDQAHPFAWDLADIDNPVATIEGPLAWGETVTLPVTLTIPLDYSAAAGQLVNTVEIAAFDDDLDPDHPAPTDIDSTPDSVNTDPASDNVIDENATTGDTSGDGVVDEDDHDLAIVSLFDLALRKALDDSTDLPVQPGQPVTFLLEVINQGAVDGTDISIADYVDLTMWQPFDPTTNPDGTTTGDQTLPYTWTANGTDGTATITGTITPGQTINLPITLTITDGADLTTLSNLAEISAATATQDDDGDPSTPPVPLVNADGSPVTDLDSTTDATNDEYDPADPDNDNTIDDEVDNNANAAGVVDEDDHDIAVVPPSTWSLGNQVWLDTDNDGMLDADETPIEGVVVELHADTDSDGLADLDPATGLPIVLATATTDADGAYLFEDLAPGTYLVGIPASNMAPGGPLEDLAPSTPAEADPNTDVDAVDGAGDSNGLLDGSGGVVSGPVVLGDGEPLAEPGLDNDPDNSDGNENLTVDFGFWQPAPDLALRKTLDASTTLPVSAGQDVTFLIEVINQGNVDATNISIADYVDLTMWQPFDPTTNPDGTTTGDQTLPYTWTTNGTDGTATITGTITPGQTINLPITLTITDGAALEGLTNTAEISDFTPTADDDGDPTTPGVPVTMPDGTQPVDIDSTPDDQNDDVLVDDVVNNEGTDEDDHDIAVVEAPTYSLGNQVWSDADNNGILDPGESPVEGVVVHVFADADGDGQPDDQNGDGVIDAEDAISTNTTDADGAYLFSDLPVGDYIVGIAPSNWDLDGPLYGTLSSDPTEYDANTDIDDDDNGTACGCPDGYVYSGPVALAGNEPAGEPGLANDPNNPDTNANLTVDFGFWSPTFDLALRKELSDPSASVSMGELVTFTLTVTNQGAVLADEIVLIDYLPTGLELADPDWQSSNDGATMSMPTSLPAGGTISADITTKVVATGAIFNEAEIRSAVPMVSVGEAMLMPNGEPLPDLDSLADDLTTNNADSGEDDHDTAVVQVQANQPSRPLAFSGGTAAVPVAVGLALLLLGLVLVVGSRRRAN